MRVKAVRPGYYDLKRVKVGQIIDIDPKYFSKSWMESLEDKPQGRVSGSVKSKKPVEEVSQEAEVI